MEESFPEREREGSFLGLGLLQRWTSHSFLLHNDGTDKTEAKEEKKENRNGQPWPFGSLRAHRHRQIEDIERTNMPTIPYGRSFLPKRNQKNTNDFEILSVNL